MNIAVVGGSGFIGRHVVRRLVDRGHTVFTIDLHAPADLLAGENAFEVDLEREGGAESAAAAAGAVDGVVWLAATIRQVGSVDEGALQDQRVMVESPHRFLATLRLPPATLV